MPSSRPASAARRLQADPEVLQQTYRLLTGIRRIIQASDRYSRHLAATADITLPQLLVLLAAVAEEGLSTREISRRVHVSSSTLVGVIDRLEAKGLIERRRDARDRRLVHILPTPPGRRFVATAPTPLGKAFDDGFAQLSERRRKTMVGALETLADLIAAEPHAGA